MRRISNWPSLRLQPSLATAARLITSAAPSPQSRSLGLADLSGLSGLASQWLQRLAIQVVQAVNTPSHPAPRVSSRAGAIRCPPPPTSRETPAWWAGAASAVLSQRPVAAPITTPRPVVSRVPLISAAERR